MTYTPKILAFAGSTRTDSFNKKLVQIAANGARNLGATVTYIDLRDFPMPLYDEDLEKSSGMPVAARQFKELMVDHDGLLIASPEYNGSLSAVLKNAIDWASRPAAGDPPLVAFAGKVAAIMSTSPGGLGGLRGLGHLRIILSGIKVLVLPEQIAVGNAYDAFAADGSLKDEKQQAAIAALGENVAHTLAKLKG